MYLYFHVLNHQIYDKQKYEHLHLDKDMINKEVRNTSYFFILCNYLFSGTVGVGVAVGAAGAESVVVTGVAGIKESVLIESTAL